MRYIKRYDVVLDLVMVADVLLGFGGMGVVIHIIVILFLTIPLSFPFFSIIIDSVSICCSFFSAFGIPFLAILGALFNSQPEFVVSTLNKTEAKEYARSCYLSALIYVAALVLSLIGIFHSTWRKSRTVTHTTGDVGYMELPILRIPQR